MNKKKKKTGVCGNMILSQLPQKYQDIYFDLDIDSAVIAYAKWYVSTKVNEVYKDERDLSQSEEFNNINSIGMLIGYLQYYEYANICSLSRVIDEMVLFAVLKCQ